MEQTKNAKQNLLKQGEAEKIKLEIQEKERQTLLANLQKKQKGIQNEIRKKKRSAEQLNAQIDRLIEIEIEKARKRAEEEARRKAAAEAAAKAAAAKKAENKTTGGVTRSKSTEKNEDTRKAAPVEKFSLNNEDRQLSGSFERNRGILPVPITGPYVIVSHYGQYAVDGLRNVKLDNKGIDIKGKPGAQARAVFDGEVSAIFQYNGLNNILVRHGNYISVYCNLSSVSVSKGSKVNTRTVLELSIQIVRVIRSCIFNFVRKRLNLIRNYGWEDEKDKFSFCISVLYYFVVCRSLFGNWRASCSSCS